MMVGSAIDSSSNVDNFQHIFVYILIVLTWLISIVHLYIRKRLYADTPGSYIY